MKKPRRKRENKIQDYEYSIGLPKKEGGRHPSLLCHFFQQQESEQDKKTLREASLIYLQLQLQEPNCDFDEYESIFSIFPSSLLP